MERKWIRYGIAFQAGPAKLFDFVEETHPCAVMLISVFILQNELKFALISELEGFFVWRKVIKDPFRAVCAEIFQ